ncbi:MAG: BMP family protein [Verrucomicrobia bacterium]|nr:BMP family protein [Leptolyngbya sp. ES-bin-22]
MIKKLYARSLQATLTRLLVATPLLLLVACGGQTPTTQAPSPEASAASSPVANSAGKLALILPGLPTDKSWNQMAQESAMALKAKGVDVVTSEAVPVADVERVLRQYAEAGYTTIVAHSFNYGDAVFKVGKEFPKVNFAYAGGIGKVTENVADYDQPFYEGAYLMGKVGAQLSKSGKLGALYGFDIPVCKAMGAAALAGAKEVKPSITLVSTAVGNWSDVAKAKEAALSQADTGVDFWIGCGDGPTLGQIEAAKVKGGFSSSYVGDMTALGPNVVAVNLIWNMEPLFARMVDDTQKGTFAKQYYKMGVKEGVIKVEVPANFKEKLGAEKVKLIEDTKAKIIAGTLTVPYQPK